MRKVEFEITREVEGGYDENHQWVEGGLKVIATGKASIQPKSGDRRARETGTKYESEEIAYVYYKDLNVTVETLVFLGMPEDTQEVSMYEAVNIYGIHIIQQGDKLIDEFDKEYRILHPANWNRHYELDIEAI